MSRNNNMSSTTTLASTPTKLKRTYSLMLSPSKDSQQVDAKPSKTAPTQQQIFSWTLTPDAIASCHVRDVLSLQERTESAPTNKHAGECCGIFSRGRSSWMAQGSDFYWLGRVPCRNVRVMGLVVEVTQYELRALYTGEEKPLSPLV
jgi:solute carrier family 25 citrate transporter 1